MELATIDRRKTKLEEWRKRLEQKNNDLTIRESRILESEPFLSLAKKLQEMKLTLEDALPWIETINEVAQMQNMDSKQAAISVAEDIRLNKQLGGIARQIERANQELTLINMATLKKQQAITVVEDLINKGIRESHIVQLIKFSPDRQVNLQQPIINNGNHRQPGSSSPGRGSSIPGPVNNGGPSMNDFIRLHLLKTSNTSILNRMAHGIKTADQQEMFCLQTD